MSEMCIFFYEIHLADFQTNTLKWENLVLSTELPSGKLATVQRFSCFTPPPTQHHSQFLETSLFRQNDPFSYRF